MRKRENTREREKERWRKEGDGRAEETTDNRKKMYEGEEEEEGSIGREEERMRGQRKDS